MPESFETIETIPLPLHVTLYPEQGFIIMNFSKRLHLTPENKRYWIPLLNQVANGKKIPISAVLTCRDEMMSKFTLKKLGLLEPAQKTTVTIQATIELKKTP